MVSLAWSIMNPLGIGAHSKSKNCRSQPSSNTGFFVSGQLPNFSPSSANTATALGWRSAIERR